MVVCQNGWQGEVLTSQTPDRAVGEDEARGPRPAYADGEVGGGASRLVAEAVPQVSAIGVLLCSDLLALTVCVTLVRWWFGPPGNVTALLLLVGALSFGLGLALLDLYPGRGVWGPARIRCRALMVLIAFVSPAVAGMLLQPAELGPAAAQCLVVGVGLFFLSSFFELVAIRIADSLGWWRSRAVFIGDPAVACHVKRDLHIYPELGLELVERQTDPGIATALNPIDAKAASRHTESFVFDPTSPLPRYYHVGRAAALGHRGGKESIARVLKRVLDFVGAIIALIFVSPIFLGVAVMIYVLDGRPILFCQERGGVGGKRVRICKFRSMYRDAQHKLDEMLAADPAARAEWDRHFKLRNDPRVLPKIGNIIRYTSIDELPQLWNVLKGDMSLVGPRPFPENHLAVFSPEFRSIRARVVPGLSGLWQVTLRSNGEICDQEHLDRAYVEGWSLWLDLYILFRTPIALISGHGAS